MTKDNRAIGRRQLTVWHWYLGNAGLLVMLCLVPVWIKTALHQYPAYDLGIFAQALHSLRPSDLNPFIPALDIRLFCDHFDPILIVASPLGHLIEPAYAALLTEHMLVLLTPLPLVLLCRRQPELITFACFAITFLLFNRGIASALSFPVHPTTWASCFVVIAGVSVIQRRWAWLIVASILLMACKEEFPFVVLMIGIGLMCQKQFRVGGILVLLAVSWMVFAFGVRPWLFGNTHNYASRVLSPLFESPLEAIGGRLARIKEMKRLFQCALPLIPVAYWLYRKRAGCNWIMPVAVLPLLAIRFLDEAWKFHYLAPVAPFFLLALMGKDIAKLPRRVASLGMVLTILLSGSAIGKAVAVYGHIDELWSARRAAIEEARTYMLEHASGNAIVEGNLSPLLARRANVFQIGGVQLSQPYRFLLVEKPPLGDPWPLSHDDVSLMIDVWRKQPDTTILTDDEHIFFAERNTDGTEKSDSGKEIQ